MTAPDQNAKLARRVQFGRWDALTVVVPRMAGREAFELHLRIDDATGDVDVAAMPPGDNAAPLGLRSVRFRGAAR